MKKIAIFCLCLPLLCGCAPVLLDMDHPWDRVWSAAQQEVTELGQVKRENPKRGRLDARIDEADVVVALKQLTSSTVRVVVRARKNLLPKVDVAQKVALGIQRRVERL